MAPYYHRKDYHIGWICALPLELTAAIAMLDEYHEPHERSLGDENTYILGRIGRHNISMAALPIGEIGTNSTAQVASHMLRSFPSIKIGLLVGIAGGVPTLEQDIRLGDVVVSKPNDQNGGVFQYDMGRNTSAGFKKTGFLNAPPRALRSAISTLEGWNEIPGQHHKLVEYLLPTGNSKLPMRYAFPNGEHDELFESNYQHVGENKTCIHCDRRNVITRSLRNSHEPVVHYGIIASGNQVMKNAVIRDEIAAQHHVLCFEMEAAGLMNEFPCVVIRGICDYADSHKNKVWQPYAAATAAAYAKALLGFMPPDQIEKQSPDALLPVQLSTTSCLSEAVARAAKQSSIVSPPLETTQVLSNLETRDSGDQRSQSTSSSLDVTPTSSLNVLSQLLLPPGSIALGRLVIDTSAPWDDYCPYTPVIMDNDVVAKSHARIQEILEHVKICRFPKKLHQRLSTLVGDPLDSIRSSVPTTTYILLNSSYRFTELCGEPNIRKWLADTIKYGLQVHMVVGINTIQKSSIDRSSLDGQLQQQLVLNTDEMNTSIEANEVVSEVIPQDQLIFAVRYRRVRFKWFSSRKVDSAFLEKGLNRWKVPAISGRGDSDVSEKNDIIEADLMDALDQGDVISQGEYSFGDEEII